MYVCIYYHSLNTPVAKRGYGDFKVLNNGGLKKLIINGWVRHNGGLDLKIGEEGEPFQSNFGATKDT